MTDKQPELTPEQKQWQETVAHSMNLGHATLVLFATANQPPHIAAIAGLQIMKEGLAGLHAANPAGAAELVRLIADDFLKTCQQIGIEVADQSEAAE